MRAMKTLIVKALALLLTLILSTCTPNPDSDQKLPSSSSPQSYSLIQK